jgi:S-adenosyl methyltransferase
VTDSGFASRPDAHGWPEIDTHIAHGARVYDYLLGGKANFAVDRDAAQAAYAAWPGGLDGVRSDARAHRALLGRVVRYLASEAGTGIPKENNTHEVAQRVAPEARIVYADYDPIVLAHAHQLLTSTPQGACAYVDGDLRDPEDILQKAAGTLDFSRPAAIVLFGVLHFFADTDQPHAIASRLLEALAPGSYLAISHLARDVHGVALTETFARLNEQMSESVILRTRAEFTRLFEGTDLVDPGVVQLPHWRPGPGLEDTRPVRPLPMWCAVGRRQ